MSSDKEIKKISFQLYKLLEINDLENFNKIILDNNLSIINHPSLNSLILTFSILTNDTDKILELEKRKLMKRDYLQLSKFYLSSNPSKSEEFFDLIVSSKELLDKDIKSILDFGLVKFLYKLNGLYFNLQIDNLDDYSFLKELKDTSELKKYNISKEITEYIIKNISDKIEPKILKNFISFLEKIDFDVILDAGNIIHSISRLPSKEGVLLLKNIIKYFVDKKEKPLIIIHERHFKKFKELDEILKDLNFYKTPYKQNDDWFQLLAFLVSNKPIISKDKFRDHIFDYKTNNPNLNQFKYILGENTLSYYGSHKIKIEEINKYSNCIQFHDKKVFIPTKINNKFIWTFYEL